MRRSSVVVVSLLFLPLLFVFATSTGFAASSATVNVSATILPPPEQQMEVGALSFAPVNDRVDAAAPVAYEGSGNLVVRSGAQWSLSVMGGSPGGIDASARLDNGGDWQALVGNSVSLAAGAAGSQQIDWSMKVQVPSDFVPAPGQQSMSFGIYMMNE